jgi:iron complex transport system substrate-binding protein
MLLHRIALAAAAVLTLAPAAPAAPAASEQSRPAARIVSLAPNLTELIFTLGAGERLVGADVFSDYPPAARQVPRVGDAFQVDYERVLALQPDLVLVWDTGTPEPVIEKLKSLGLRVERISTTQLSDIAQALRRLGELTGTSAAAEQEARDYSAAIDHLRLEHAGEPPIAVFYQISASPIYTINGRHLISEMLALCGGQNVFADLEQLAPPVSLEAVLERDPETILAGDDVHGDPFAIWRPWRKLRAVQLENLYVLRVDRIARATTRIVAGAEDICGVLDQARERRVGKSMAGGP